MEERRGGERTDKGQGWEGWRAVVVTGAHEDVAAVVAVLRQRRAQLDEASSALGLGRATAFVAAPDFAPPSTPLGSGAVTLNALLVVAEHLSAQEGYSFVESHVVHNGPVVVVHLGGRDRPRVPPAEPVPKALASLPLEPATATTKEQKEGGRVEREETLVTLIDLLLAALARLCHGLQSGVVIASTEAVLVIPPGIHGRLATVDPNCATLLAVEAPAAVAPLHGVCTFQRGAHAPGSHSLYREVSSILYQESVQNLRQKGALIGQGDDARAYIYTGIVVLGSTLAEEILRLNAVPPLDSCTYLAVDNGATPVAFDLYSDMLLALAAGTDKEAYLAQPSRLSCPPARVRLLRETAWQYLRANGSSRLHGCIIRKDDTSDEPAWRYLRSTSDLSSLLHKPPPGCVVVNRVHALIEDGVQQAEDCVVMNTIALNRGTIGQGSLIAHSWLEGQWSIGENSLVYGIRGGQLHVPSQTYIHELELPSSSEGTKQLCLVIMGVRDDIEGTCWFGNPISRLFHNCGWDARDAWVEGTQQHLRECRLFPMYSESEAESVRSLMLAARHELSMNIKSANALEKLKSLPRTSLAELLHIALPQTELRWREDLRFRVAEEKVARILLSRSNACLNGLFEPFIRAKRPDILHALDRVAIKAAREGDALVVMRTLATMADVLAAFAGPRAGLRSGPARNRNWQSAFELLAQHKLEEAVTELARQRLDWLRWETPELLMRAVRHYERAAQVMISLSVQTAQSNVTSVKPLISARAPFNTWVVVELPARMDFAGGWTDTPPITFEHGGCVVNMALLVDGKKPISAKARRVEQYHVVIEVGDERTECNSIDDFYDHAQPLAPGALIKTVLLYIGLISLSSSQSLEEQLAQSLGSGLHVVCTTSLPQGSGLGTSSIMAGALLKAIGAVSGHNYDSKSLVHAVLMVEQMLTTGGGWQDQVGGLLPGFKFTVSPGRLPLTVEYEVIEIPSSFIDLLNRHMVCIYTGRTRLARGLLQDVLRRWHARLPEIVGLATELVENARRLREALVAGDLEQVGACLSIYWNQKKSMAGGAEPAEVTAMIERLKEDIYGCALGGAGGGGFLVIVTKRPDDMEHIRALLAPLPHAHSLSFHACAVDLVPATARMEHGEM